MGGIRGKKAALRATVAALACAAAGSTRGVEAPPPDALEEFDEEVVVRAPSRLLDGSSRRKDPAQRVVAADELRAAGARSLQEALLLLPGVHLSDEQGNPLQQGLVLRGLTASPVTGLPQGVSVFVDGVRVNEPAVEEVNFELVPLDDVERIELVRGPHAVFGRNSLGGAIHVTTRRGSREPRAEVEATGGSALHQELRAAVGGPVGPLDGYLSLSGRQGGGWRNESDAGALRGFGKLGLRAAELDAALSYQLQVDDVGQPGSLPLALLRQDPSENYTPGDFFRPVLHLAILNGRARLAPSLSLAANAFFRALDAEQFNASWLAADTRLFNTTRSVGATLQLEHAGRLGSLRTETSAGAEAGRSTVRVLVHEEANAQHATDEDGDPLPKVDSDIRDAQLALAAFVQHRVRAVSGPLAGLSATGSLRFDRIAHAIRDHSPEEPGKADDDPAFSRLVPAAGVSWALSPRWIVAASWSSGFRAPAFLELTCSDPEDPCVGLQAGVAPDTAVGQLEPVRSRTLEAGLTASPRDDLTVTIDAFRIDLDDDVFSVTEPGANRIFFQNVGATRRQGVEVSARGGRGPVEVAGSYAFTLATFERDLVLATPRFADGTTQAVRRGSELPLNPRHRADLECRVRPLRWLRLFAGAAYVGSQWLRGDEANETERLDGYLLVRAGAEARWRAWSAFVRATNLLDRRHEVFGTFSVNRFEPGAPQPFLMPGAPLLVNAGLRWELE